MRPYLTVIYDSFHEAFVSRVLYILLLALTLVLLAIAPLGYETKRMVTLHRMSIRDVPSFVQELQQQESAEGENPSKRVVALASGPLKELVTAKSDERITRNQVNDVVDGLNSVLTQKEFYSEAAWKDVRLGEETKVLLKQGPDKLTGDDLSYLNRLLMRDAFPVYLGNVPAEQLYLTYPLLWEPLPLPITQEMFATTVKYMLTAFIDVFVGMFAIFVAILVTAPIMPRTFEPGAIDLLLSKPISRSLLILAKYLGGCAFVLLSVTYFLVGLYLIVGWRFDVWSNALLFCIPVFLFQFAIYYCVSVLAGVMWRNSIVSIVVTVLFFYACFGIGFLKTSVFEPFIINPSRLVRLVDTDEGLVGVTQVGQFVQWNESLESWEVVLQSERRGPENFAMQSILIGPIYHAPTQRMMYLQQPTGGGSRRRGGTSFLTAKWSGNWVAEEGPGPPTGASWILQDADDNVLIVSSAGVFLYEGDGTQKKANFLGFDIPLGGNNAFKRIGPGDGVPYFPPFAAAMDASSNRLLIQNQGTLYLLERDPKKGYVVKTEAQREEDGETAVGLTGKLAVVADEDGHVELRDAETLEVQKSFRPAGDTPPSSLETSRDGKYVAVLFHDGTLWLYDVEAGEGSRIDSDASAIAFNEGNLYYADNKTRVRARSLSSGETLETYWPESDWWRFTYDWVIEPIYYVFPKPGELNNLLKYLVTDESTSSFQGPQSTGDLREVRMADNIVMPVVHNLIFICVMLGITCFYVSRLDL
ncbi:ABC transporter permease subunit [Bremerella sp. JC770]|uniref:ABC transporter permease subunit n=1 Tax=Bremerella sp. JC770 TaxID=3232137 RepID=UPI00345765ED